VGSVKKKKNGGCGKEQMENRWMGSLRMGGGRRGGPQVETGPLPTGHATHTQPEKGQKGKGNQDGFAGVGSNGE